MLCAVDEATVRAMFGQQFDYARDPERSHEMYHDDAVVEFPQSGERFAGVENFSQWRSSYPASTSFEIGEVRGGDDLWVVELVIRYDGGPPNHGVSILQFREGKIARETIYVCEGWEAPEWRAQWRSA